MVQKIHSLRKLEDHGDLTRKLSASLRHFFFTTLMMTCCPSFRVGIFGAALILLICCEIISRNSPVVKWQSFQMKAPCLNSHMCITGFTHKCRQTASQLFQSNNAISKWTIQLHWHRHAEASAVSIAQSIAHNQHWLILQGHFLQV